MWLIICSLVNGPKVAAGRGAVVDPGQAGGMGQGLEKRSQEAPRIGNLNRKFGNRSSAINVWRSPVFSKLLKSFNDAILPTVGTADAKWVA
jgi:hypothetical protein